MTRGENALLRVLQSRVAPPAEVIKQPHLGPGRADAAVFHPDRGVVLYEVKDYLFDGPQGPSGFGPLGFEFKLDPRGGLYPKGRDPIEQLQEYRDELLDECTFLSGSSSPWPSLIRGVVVMTDASTEQAREWARTVLGRAGDGAVTVVGGRDLDRLGTDALVPLVRRDMACVRAHRDAIRVFFDPPVVAAEMAVPLQLNKLQTDYATRRPPRRHRRIRGPAGSGKSQVLAARAGELSHEGKAVLVTCYNITLANYLRMLFLRHRVARDGSLWVDPSRVIFMHFHRWASWVIDLAGLGEERRKLEVEDETDSRKYGELAERAIRQARLVAGGPLDAPPFAFDAVLVDEGQDFCIEWWGALQAVCRSGGEMLLLADATQDIYRRGTAWTDQPMRGTGFGPWAKLIEAYRLPPGMVPVLRSFADRYMAGGRDVYLPSRTAEQLSLLAPRLVWVSLDSDEQMCHTVREELSRLRSMGVRDGDVAVLTLDNAQGDKIARHLRRAGLRVGDIFGEGREGQSKKRAFRPLAGRVSVSTIASYKGWEATAIILVIGARATRAASSVLYAGLTRLRAADEPSHMTVINASSHFEPWGTTFAQHSTG